MPDSPRYSSVLSSIVENPLPTEVLKILGSEKESEPYEPNKHLNLEMVLDADFIRYFLSYLRLSFGSLLRKDECTRTLKSSVKKSLDDDDANSKYRCLEGSGSYKCNLMSTPKVRGHTSTTFSNWSQAHASERVMDANTAYHHARQSGETSQSQKKFGTDGKHVRCKSEKNKQKLKSLSLHDFLSNNTKPSKGSAHKVFSPKTNSEKVKLNAAKSNALLSRFESRLTNPEGSRKVSSRRSRADAPVSSQTNESISFRFDDESDFPNLSLERPLNRSSKPTRRIKPTAVQNPKSTDNSVNLSRQSTSTPKENIVESNEVVLNVSESEKLQQFSWCCNKSPTEKALSFQDISPVKKTAPEPNISQVIDQKKLKRFANIYAYYIGSFLVPCVVSELQFVVELLTITSSCETKDDITGSLCNSEESNPDDPGDVMSSKPVIVATVANAVYLSTSVLHALASCGVAYVFGRSTLVQLSQSFRVQEFDEALETKLVKLVADLDQAEKEPQLRQNLELRSSALLSGVPFEVETDNRSNFSSDKSFHAFRKQRDSFYSLISEYERRRLQPNFSIQQNLNGKIKNLVSELKSYAILKPFVRLFVSQLLQSVNYDQATPGSKPVSEFDKTRGGELDAIDQITSLRNEDPDKLRRLQSRFTTSSTRGNAKVLQDALSDQCFFYKEFLLCADSHVLNANVCNEIHRRIEETTSVQTQQILDDVLSESITDKSISVSVADLITSLRLLGRLLGFVTFLSYNADLSLAHPINNGIFHHINMSLSEVSHASEQLASVPWILEFLKSANKLPLDNREVQDIVKKLFEIYRKHTFDLSKASTLGDVLISLGIASLLHSPALPDEYFYQLLKQCPRTSCMPNTIQLIRKQEYEVDSQAATFDECCLPYVSSYLICSWHYALKEISSSVAAFNSGITAVSNRSQPQIRKIKPSTEKNSEETIAQIRKSKSQHVLEEHFFRGQSSSLKRTVSFVAERCASNCVKHLRSVTMLKACDEAEKLYLNKVSNCSGNQLCIKNDVKMAITREVAKEMQSLAAEWMKTEAERFCNKAVGQCMNVLSSCEMADGVLKISIAIARKQALASVHLWLRTRLNELVEVSIKSRLSKVHKVEQSSLQILFFLISDFFSHKDASAAPELCTVIAATDVKNEMKSDHEITSLSTLLQLMKDYIALLTFRNSDDVSADTDESPSLTERDVSSVLATAVLLLHKEIVSEDVVIVNADHLEAMRSNLVTSPYMKASLLLAARELARRITSYFPGCTFATSLTGLFNNLAESD